MGRQALLLHVSCSALSVARRPALLIGKIPALLLGFSLVVGGHVLSRKKTVWGTNFKDNEHIAIVLAWEDNSRNAGTRKVKREQSIRSTLRSISNIILGGE